MNITEYENVKKLNYLQYCNYLQNKYGIGICDYMTESWTKNKCSRTSEGLYAHHKYEDHAIRLSDVDCAMKNPYEWQKAENIVYCDMLEHLYLHILICESPSKDKNTREIVGIGGIFKFFVPTLNDVYSGWKSNKQWEIKCHQKIINDKDVYLILIERFKKTVRNILCLMIDIFIQVLITKVVSGQLKIIMIYLMNFNGFSFNQNIFVTYKKRNTAKQVVFFVYFSDNFNFLVDYNFIILYN